MARSRRASGGRATAWLVGILVPLLMLFAGFSLMPYTTMSGHWPLGITPEEVAQYQRWFDRRPAGTVSARVETFVLDSVPGSRPVEQEIPHDPDKHPHWFSSEGYQDSVKVRRLLHVPAGWVVDLPKERLFRGQRSLVLMPADLASVRAKYAQMIAEANGVTAPDIGFVRLRWGGRDLGLYRREERVTGEFLEKRRMADAFPIEGLRGQVEGDHGDLNEQRLRAGLRVDSNAVALLMLLAQAEGRDPLDVLNGPFAWDRSTGRYRPIYRPAHGRGLFAVDATDQEVDGPAWASAMRHWAGELRADSSRIAERMAAISALWMPALAQAQGRTGMPLGLLNAKAEAERTAFLHTVLHPDLGGAEASPSDSVTPPPPPMDPWLTPYLGADDTLRFPRGTYTVDHDVWVPPGRAVVIEKGAHFFLAAGVSFVVNGPLHVRANGINPVFVRPRDEAPFGTFCVNGTGATPCRLKGLRISGGSTAWTDGRYHSATLSMHDADVVMDGCDVRDGRGEDAVNLKRCKVVLRDCTFGTSADDIVDLDLVRGSVEGCTFVCGTRSDTTGANGDGLDINGSFLLVRSCTFSGLHDKGISIGEASQALVLDCAFTDTHLAMAVKDLSVAHVDGCTFTGNGTVFGIYRKKPVFGGGYLYAYTNTFSGNALDREMDGESKVVAGDHPTASVLSSFGAAPVVAPRRR